MSHADASDSGPCEGRSFPSNPSQDRQAAGKTEFDTFVNFRCTTAEKQVLIEKANRAGIPFAKLMREALGLVDSRRRKPVPRVDPELIRAVSRVGSNVNQIARWLNAMTAAGHVTQVEAFVVASRLVAVDRALNGLICTTASKPQNAEKPEC